VEIPLLFGFGTWFLVSILGRAAWVGLIVMIALTPVPGWASHAIHRVQHQKMAASDARIKAVTDTLNVLRMVKQLGWEAEVTKQIEAHRAEELVWIFRRKMLNLFIAVVK
jgi:ketopantoate reductase